jgi:hypothetical protein
LEGVVGLFFGLAFYEGAKAGLVDGVFEEFSALVGCHVCYVKVLGYLLIHACCSLFC